MSSFWSSFETLSQGELQAHIDDATDAHDASAISLADSGGNTSETDVEGAIDEIYNLIDALGPGSGDGFTTYESRSSNTILGVSDAGKIIDITATITQTFEADETLGSGWWVVLRNATDDGTVVVTLNPDGSETIDGVASPKMYAGETRLIWCKGGGNNFVSLLLSGGYVVYTADDNFTVPAGITEVLVDCIGAGGGGGGGRGGAVNSSRMGGGGGGGGARSRVSIAASALGNPGDTIAVDVATGGTFGPGGSSGNGTSGGVGGTTTFGTFVSAYGGGGGFGGQNTTGSATGGSGGGVGEAGTTGALDTATRGGGHHTAALAGMGGAGGGTPNGGSAANTNSAEWGGGGGGRGTQTGGGGGGDSLWGGGAGAGGAGVNTSNSEGTGAIGGGTGQFGFGNGGSAGAANGGGAGNGDPGNLRVCGEGGGGGGGQDSGTGGVGGDGGAPGGGGGGGGGGTTTGGAGGTGGRGECRVWYS